MRTCPDCLSIYKKSKAGRAARKSHGAWGHGHWPTDVYHSQPTSKCFKHHTQSLADSAARRAGKDMPEALVLKALELTGDYKPDEVEQAIEEAQ